MAALMFLWREGRPARLAIDAYRTTPSSGELAVA